MAALPKPTMYSSMVTGIRMEGNPLDPEDVKIWITYPDGVERLVWQTNGWADRAWLNHAYEDT